MKADDRRKGGEKGSELDVMEGALRCLRIHGAALGGEVAGDLAAVAADDGVQHELVVSNSVVKKGKTLLTYFVLTWRARDIKPRSCVVNGVRVGVGMRVW